MRNALTALIFVATCSSPLSVQVGNSQYSGGRTYVAHTAAAGDRSPRAAALLGSISISLAGKGRTLRPTSRS